MKRNGMLLAAALVFSIPAIAAEETTTWSSIERDVWIDQSLMRPILAYRAADSGAILLVADELRDAVVLDAGSGEVRSISKEAVSPNDDHSRVTTRNEPGLLIGSVMETEDGVTMATAGRKTIVISRHQSPSGEIDPERLLNEYPVWAARVSIYEPDPVAIEHLRAIEVPTELSVVFATWCGDSRREVPRLLKTVEVAQNPNLHVRLIGIDSEFEQPLDVIQERRIINVPTVIVERGGEEIGRFIETPAAGAIEQDLVAILEGNPAEHPGRWEREARQSRGTYELELPNGDRGEENWEIFATASGGKLAHSVIQTPRFEREIWHRFDDQGRTEFIEITDRTDDGIRRSRIRVSDDHIRVHSRGNRSGIIDQYLGVPSNCVFATGSALTEGLECLPMSESGAAEIVRYAVPLDECGSLGCLETVKFVRGSSTEIEIALGRLAVSEIETATAGEQRRVWIGKDLEIPVRIEGPERRAVLLRYLPEG